SLLWWRSGSRQRGVHNAVRVGRLFAYLMIAGGVLGVFLGGGLNGAWMAILGWFLLSAGASEEAGSAVRSLLRSVPVSAAMTSPVVTLPDRLRLGAARARIRQRQAGRHPVAGRHRARADDQAERRRGDEDLSPATFSRPAS